MYHHQAKTMRGRENSRTAEEIELHAIQDSYATTGDGKSENLSTKTALPWPIVIVPDNTSKIHHMSSLTSGSLGNNLKVTAAVSFYIITSIAMIVINKIVLREVGLPLSFLWGQLVVAAVILKLLERFGIITQLPPANWSAAWNAAPLILINVVGLTLNTLCLHHVDAVLYQVARSLILPMTVALSPLLGQRISLPILSCCVLISVGFAIGLFGEQTANAQISHIGVFFGVASSLTTALHSFIIKRSFSTVKHNGAFDLVYLNNLFSAVLLLPLLLVESAPLGEIISTGGALAIKNIFFGTLLAGLAGLLINFAGFLQIKVTSPVTHTVSSAARGVLQTLTAHIFLGEAITVARCIGIAVTLLGSCAYSLVKARENLSLSSFATAPEYSKVSPVETSPGNHSNNGR